MANQQTGRVIAVSKEQTVASADPNKQPFKKREIYIDCTRYDPYTGQRSQYENKPLLEFSGDKTLEKVNPVLDQVQKDDIVTISFELVGRHFQDRDGKQKFITGIRCYDIQIVRKAGVQQQAPAPQPAPQQAQQAPQPQQSPFANANDDDLPF